MKPVWKLSFVQAAGLAAVVYAGIFCLTVPESIADTVVYAGDIQQYIVAGRTAAGSLLWEPGHALWRPIGYRLWTLLHSTLAAGWGGDRFLQIVVLLTSANFLCGLALTLLALSLGRRLGLSMGAAFAVALGLLSSSAILNYVHSGTAYIPGLTASFAGLWLILKAVESPSRALLYAGLSGAALALACALWLPYALSVPAALLAGWVFGNRGRQRARVVLTATATAFVVGVVAMGTAAAMAGVALPMVKDWLVNSGHGVQTDRRLVRFPSGLTRSFFFLGDDARLIKRYVFGDPYEPVGTMDVLRAGLWKIPLVFASGGTLLWALWRRTRTRSAAWVVLTGIVPTIAFAILVFETGAPERYLPLYPAVFFGVCVALSVRSQLQNRSLIRILGGAFLTMLLLVNYRAYGWDLRTLASSGTTRSTLIREHAPPPGIVFLLSFRDPVSSHFQRSPFAPDNRNGPLSLYHVIEPGNVRLDLWRSDSACRILDAWSAHGDAWLSLRLLAPRPEPAWQWTEHDDPRVHWVDLPAFFAPLETGARIGDADGFALVVQSEHNKIYLENACRR